MQPLRSKDWGKNHGRNSGKNSSDPTVENSLKKQTRMEKDANHITMGTETMEESDEEKYLNDQIHNNGWDTSILSNIYKRIAKSIYKLNEILGLLVNSLISGMKPSLCARNLYKRKVATSPKHIIVILDRI